MRPQMARTQIIDSAGFDPIDAMRKVNELLAEGLDEATIRSHMDWIPSVHWRQLYLRAKAIRDTLEYGMPPELREPWFRAKTNQLVEENMQTNPGVAVKALALIGKEFANSATTVHIDMESATRLSELSKERMLELKASDGIYHERKEDEERRETETEASPDAEER